MVKDIELTSGRGFLEYAPAPESTSILHLKESYGDRFYVHSGMKELVEAGNLGQKTGKGFYEHGS